LEDSHGNHFFAIFFQNKKIKFIENLNLNNEKYSVRFENLFGPSLEDTGFGLEVLKHQITRRAIPISLPLPIRENGMLCFMRLKLSLDSKNFNVFRKIKIQLTLVLQIRKRFLGKVPLLSVEVSKPILCTISIKWFWCSFCAKKLLEKKKVPGTL